jgi:Cu-Zn family superoxide dismutase
MGMRGVGLVCSGVLLAVSLWIEPVMAQVQPPTVGASAQIYDARGVPLAVATFREAPDQTLINLVFADRGLTGNHAIHIHDTGRCDPPNFLSAGAIFNPFGRQHGLLNSDGPMAGDMANLVIGPDGIGGYNTTAPQVKLSPGPASLLRSGGTSIVIFAQGDDDKTQPEGNSGARIACGVIVAGPPSATAAAPIPVPGNLGRPDTSTALIIALVGLLLIGVGVFLRQRRRVS